MTGSPSLGRRAAAEALGTFALVFAGCGAIVTDAERGGALGVVAIGLVLFLVLLAAIAAAVGLAAIAFGPLTGASLNPARSFGPGLAAGQWHDFWIYLAGPLTGAPLGAFAYNLLRDGDRPLRLPA